MGCPNRKGSPLLAMDMKLSARWTFPMFGYFYQTSSSAGAFIGGILFQDGAFATIQGTAKFDRRTGAVTSLSGEFIQNEVFFVGCFSSGRSKAKKYHELHLPS